MTIKRCLLVRIRPVRVCFNNAWFVAGIRVDSLSMRRPIRGYEFSYDERPKVFTLPIRRFQSCPIDYSKGSAFHAR